MKTITAKAPSGQDYSDNLNEIVRIKDANADGFIEVELVDDSSSEANDGVIISADVNGTLTVAISGVVNVYAQAAVTIGTHRFVMAGDSSRATPATAGNNYLGRVVGPGRDVASGQYVSVCIEPGSIPAP